MVFPCRSTWVSSRDFSSDLASFFPETKSNFTWHRWDVYRRWDETGSKIAHLELLECGEILLFAEQRVHLFINEINIYILHSCWSKLLERNSTLSSSQFSTQVSFFAEKSSDCATFRQLGWLVRWENQPEFLLLSPFLVARAQEIYLNHVAFRGDILKHVFSVSKRLRWLRVCR